jgi:arylsulfatase A-like enzyme
MLPRVSFLRLAFLATAVCAIVCGPQLATGQVSTKRPNVLFFAVDDLRTDIGCYGHQEAKTPHIDALASRGMVFRRAYCQQAVCSPSRTSLLTGLRPDSTKVYDLVTHFRNTAPDAISLPQHFRENGYYAVGMGKIFHPGFDDPKAWSEPHKNGPGEQYVLPENQQRMAAGNAKPRPKRTARRARHQPGPAAAASHSRWPMCPTAHITTAVWLTWRWPSSPN